MIALIPARGGSKGLPGKNIKHLCGKPLIAYSIESAINCKLISEVFVSTDSEDIKNVSVKYGANVPFLRPKELAEDESLAIDTYLHFIDFYEKKNNCSLDELIVLLPTSPLRKSIHIEEAIKMFHNNYADSIISYTIEQHPISWHREIDADFKIKQLSNEKLKNRQEEIISYYPNGSIYIFKTELLRKFKYYSNFSYAYIMDRKYSIDIDSIEDFEYAEFLISKYGV